MSLLTEAAQKVNRRRPFAVATVDLLRPSQSIAAAPISFGVPLKRGKCWSPNSTGYLVAPTGEVHVAQLRPLSRWFDGSVRWLLVDSIASVTSTDGKSWQVRLYQDSETIGTHCDGQLAHSRSNTQPEPADEFVALVLQLSRWRIVDKSRRSLDLQLGAPQWRVGGPVRTTMVQSGRISQLPGIEIDVQWDFFPSEFLARCNVTLRNSRRAWHRGGLWDLGDPGSHLFEEFSYALSLPERAAKCELSVEPSMNHPTAAGDVKLYQDSSGGENWKSLAHINRLGDIPCQFRGYKLWLNGEESSGMRARPVLNVESGGIRFSVAMPNFWQQFPKSLGVKDGEISLGLFPAEWEDFHELQGGEQKSHEFWLSVRSIDAPAASLDWVYSPARFVPCASACLDDRELNSLHVGHGYASECFQQLMTEALEGEHSIVAQRERVDEYGWRNFGDFYADHEELHYKGQQPLISHYNNQFDVLRGLLLQSVRTQDDRWFELAEALARHVIDIDIYHAESDRAAYSGGMFWFTDHYLHAHTSTHRTYSRHNVRSATHDYGGGPGAEHNYTSGLKLYFCLTGDGTAKQAVIGLADWVINMEDGRQTVLGLVDDGPTGFATAGYAKPGRGGANSINALLDAWELTHRSEYIEFAEQLIRRCIHPEADVADLDLLNLEVSWSYTMFYSSLAKYLALKEEAGQLDAMYAYARRCLLRLGEWMVTQERPYFDQREKLEYPTEAWPAQELRKANVLRYAARYADEPAATAMRQRANELGDRAWSDLMSFQTRTVARALALVMNEGMLDCASRNDEVSPPPIVAAQFKMPPREEFTTQRQRVVNRLKSPWGVVHVASQLLKPYSWSRAYKLLKRASST